MFTSWRLLRMASPFTFTALALIASACSSAAPADSAMSTGSTASNVSEETHASVELSPAASDIVATLQKIPGVVEVREITSRFPNTRYFVLGFEQPVDHFNPHGPTFTQRLTLLFRSYDAPMVLATTGYGIQTVRAVQSEPTFMMQGNQLLVEHRYFAPSIPNQVPLDWSKLDIFQMATDEHRIVQALKPLFSKKWLSTGGSKGGMTAIYHRFFYPNDVHVTVPYVAPNSYGTSDPRYIGFLAHVGDAGCREKLKSFQVDVLRHRDEIESRMAAEAAAAGDAYELSGGIHRALDYTINEAPFTFWQYGATTCAAIPPEAATADQLYGFLGAIYGTVHSAFGDAALTYFAPYYYQAATELGGPGYDYSHMRRLLTPHFRDVPQEGPPLGVPKPFKFASMPLVETWVRLAGERMLFIYGEVDPWSSGAFHVRRENDSYRYFVPNGNHGSNITRLPEPQRAEAMANIARWMDTPIAPSTLAALDSANDTDEPPFETFALWRREHPTGD